jgi:hypothetical protein
METTQIFNLFVLSETPCPTFPPIIVRKASHLSCSTLVPFWVRIRICGHDKNDEIFSSLVSLPLATSSLVDIFVIFQPSCIYSTSYFAFALLPIHLLSMTQSALYIVTLVVYVILVQPITYCAWKHGRHGLLGWLVLQSFCGIRVVGSILNLHEDASTAALIISNVGLSPLLLGTAGVLHEA